MLTPGLVTLIRGDARRLPLPDESVDLIVTSPPYFALRSYTDGGEHYEGQIGNEATPADYIAALIECTRAWLRVLKPSGSIFVNLGDKYSGQPGGPAGKTSPVFDGRKRAKGWTARAARGHLGIPSKSLMLLPERYRIACVDDLGLIARAVIVWAKPNGLPESVTDRVRRAHEDWVHLTRQPRYFAAVDEIREPHAEPNGRPGYGRERPPVPGGNRGTHVGRAPHADQRDMGQNPLGKLPGSVWTIATQPLTVPPELGVDHFAAFPTEWPRRIILGWSPSGICTACGEGRRPVVDKPGKTGHDNNPMALQRISTIIGGAKEWAARAANPDRIVGYACACPEPVPPTRPAVVLDPFGGTGTTAMVASVLGRHGISVDMSADYCRLAQWRTTDPKQRERAARVPKPRTDTRTIETEKTVSDATEMLQGTADSPSGVCEHPAERLSTLRSGSVKCTACGTFVSKAPRAPRGSKAAATTTEAASGGEFAAPAAPTSGRKFRSSRAKYADEDGVEHEGNGRYLLPHPLTGEEQSWQRASTFAKTLADRHGLEKWGLRMAVKGMALRPDLIAAAAACDPEEDKGRLQEIAEAAQERAGSTVGRNDGDARHRAILARIKGKSLDLPDAMRADVDAAMAEMQRQGLVINPALAERVVVIPSLGVAGRWDLLAGQPEVRGNKPFTIVDYKSNQEKSLEYAWDEHGIQFCLYSMATHMWDPESQSYIDLSTVPIDRERALLIHVPAGKGEARTYGVDLIDAQRKVKLCAQVIEERKHTTGHWLVDPDPVAYLLHRVQRAELADLARLWDEGQAAGTWTVDVNAAAAQRWTELQPVAA